MEIQFRYLNQPMLANADLDELMQDPPTEVGENVSQWLSSRLSQHSAHRDWLLSKTFWADRETDNIDGLFRHLVSLTGSDIEVPAPVLRSPLRVFVDGKSIPPDSLMLSPQNRWIAVIDYETGGRPGERDLIDQLCAQIEVKQSMKCITILAKWGESSVSASQLLAKHKEHISAVVSLQNFVLGGGDGRVEVNNNLAQLNVPVLKGLRLSDSTADEYRLSEEGLRSDSVHYRVAMPELQGISQPLVLAAMTEASIDSLTGVKLALSKPIDSQVSLMAQRVLRWSTLQEKSNKDKRVAIIYYNHPLRHTSRAWR